MSKMVSKAKKTISIEEDTYDRLYKHGRYRDTLDDIISRMIDAYEKAGGSKQH